MANHGDVAPSHSGLTFGIANTIATIPGITAGPLTTFLVRHSSWKAAWLLAAAINIAGALIFATYARTQNVILREASHNSEDEEDNVQLLNNVEASDQ